MSMRSSSVLVQEAAPAPGAGAAAPAPAAVVVGEVPSKARSVTAVQAAYEDDNNANTDEKPLFCDGLCVIS